MSDPATPTTPIHDLNDRRACWSCVSESYLSSQIENNGLQAKCSYCSCDALTFSVSEIADEVRTILKDFFQKEYSDPGETPKGDLVANIINERLELYEPDLAEDIRCVLSEMHTSHDPDDTHEQNPFGGTERYTEMDTINPIDFEKEWILFELGLKEEARFFNHNAENFLADIFDGLDAYTTSIGRSIIVEAGPETEFPRFHRARVFQPEADQLDSEFAKALKRPDRELGPPPASKSEAGRMHSVGIPAFYGATTQNIALAEVRPPVGSKMLIACFEVTRCLRLLNLAALDDVADPMGSLFDQNHRHQLKRAAFLRGLSARLAKAVLPDHEPLEYLATQAIAEFVATRDQPPLPLDGILYPSVQVGLPPVYPHARRPTLLGGPKPWECNVVLFRDAARVQPLDEGAEISISEDSQSALAFLGRIDFSPGVNYFVTVKPKGEQPSGDESMDERPLRFSSMQVRDVKAVKYETIDGYVHRSSKTTEGKA